VQGLFKCNPLSNEEVLFMRRDKNSPPSLHDERCSGTVCFHNKAGWADLCQHRNCIRADGRCLEQQQQHHHFATISQCRFSPTHPPSNLDLLL
jgi:hypothetical protein